MDANGLPVFGRIIEPVKFSGVILACCSHLSTDLSSDGPLDYSFVYQDCRSRGVKMRAERKV